MSDEMTLEQALILLDESRQHNAAMLGRLYEALNIDSDDGEIRFKWAMLAVNQVIFERDTLKQQNAELAAQVEVMKKGIHHFNRTHGDLNPLFKAAFSSTPAQCLLEVKADAGRGGFLAGIDELLIADATYRHCSAEDMADEYANKIRGGE